MIADCQKFVLHIQWAQIIGTPDRKWTNITKINSKQYIYRQTQNTNMINTVPY